MGLIVLGYGIVTMGFYGLLIKTAKPVPELELFSSASTSNTVPHVEEPAHIEKKAA